jgi:hypothetical protein
MDLDEVFATRLLAIDPGGASVKISFSDFSAFYMRTTTVVEVSTFPSSGGARVNWTYPIHLLWGHLRKEVGAAS